MAEASDSRDLTRQVAVIAAFCFMIVGAMVGIGLFDGTAVQDLQNGALDSDGSYLAPARQAFSIWSVIYVGLFAYTLWQALLPQRHSERQRALGWLIALTMVLNGLWLVTAQFLTLPLTVLAIVLLLAALAVTFRRTVAVRRRGWVDALLIDGVTGLHLGWVTLATVANTTAWLTQSGFAPGAPDAWGVVVLVVVAVIGVAIPFASGGRLAPGLAIAWGSIWVGVARLTGEPASVPIGVTALVVAAVVLAAAVLSRVRAVAAARADLARRAARPE